MIKNKLDKVAAFNELIVLGEKVKKKGGSMAAVFKLIQELLEFEEKVEECAQAQEMSQNKQKIESFISDIDSFYDVLFEMARGGISDIRNQRQIGGVDGVEEAEGEVVEREAPQETFTEESLRAEMKAKRKPEVMITSPRPPTM